MSELYLMTGLSGVGKTTVIKRALELGAVFDHGNYGDVMLSVGQDRGLVKSRDELKYLSDHQQRELQRETVKYITKLEGKVLIDTHFALETPKGYLPGVPRQAIEHFANKVKGIIVIEAPAEEIAKRKAMDVAVRERMERAVTEINEQLEMDRTYAAILSFEFSRPLKIIQNVDLEAAAQELADLLK